MTTTVHYNITVDDKNNDDDDDDDNSVRVRRLCRDSRGYVLTSVRACVCVCVCVCESVIAVKQQRRLKRERRTEQRNNNNNNNKDDCCAWPDREEKNKIEHYL